MPLAELDATAVFLARAGLLLLIGMLSGKAAQKVGLPAALVFLLLGLLAGACGPIQISPAELPSVFRLGTASLVLILFDGGLGTHLGSARKYLAPSALLATVGVLITAGLAASSARLFGLGWGEAALLGAIVSSTDAAAVFSVLRGSGLPLKKRVGTTLEVESGLNDPMAVLLTTALTTQLVSPGSITPSRLALEVLLEVVVGVLVGAAIGGLGARLLRWARLGGPGLYPVLTVGMALGSYGVSSLLHGSGFLSVYVAAVVLGDSPLPFRASIRRVHDALAWLSQAAMFLVLGLLASPSRLVGVWPLGLFLALFVAVVARPFAVTLCLLPFQYPIREIAYVGWVGLRGAVPIVLSLLPVIAGVSGAERLFDVVFCVVVAGAIVPGGTVGLVTRALQLERRAPVAPGTMLEIDSAGDLRGELLTFHVDPALAVCGATIGELPFPDGTSVLLVVRGDEVLSAKGSTQLQAGDHVHVFAPAHEVPLLYLLFGRPEED